MICTSFPIIGIASSMSSDLPCGIPSTTSTSTRSASSRSASQCAAVAPVIPAPIIEILVMTPPEMLMSKFYPKQDSDESTICHIFIESFRIKKGLPQSEVLYDPLQALAFCRFEEARCLNGGGCTHAGRGHHLSKMRI